MLKYEHKTIEHTNFIPVGHTELDSLSQENKSKVEVLKELIPNYLKSHVISDGGYGDLFDRFYDKKMSYLVALNELYK